MKERDRDEREEESKPRRVHLSEEESDETNSAKKTKTAQCDVMTFQRV